MEFLIQEPKVLDTSDHIVATGSVDRARHSACRAIDLPSPCNDPRYQGRADAGWTDCRLGHVLSSAYWRTDNLELGGVPRFALRSLRFDRRFSIGDPARAGRPRTPSHVSAVVNIRERFL